MAKLTVSVEVSKETSEVGALLVGLVKAIKAKKGIAEIAGEELPALMKAVDGITSVPAEYAEDHAAFLKALMLPMADIASELVGKQDAPASA